MPTFAVTVTYTKYEDHPMCGGYDIEAPNGHDAEQEARKRYADDFGFDIDYITAYTINKYK